MEPISFMLGLDPIFSHGKELVERFRTWSNNRRDLPALQRDFSAFQTNLQTHITNLPVQVAKLPQLTQELIKDDVSSLTRYLQEACETLQDVNKRLSRNPLLQFYRAKAVANDCDTLKEKLEKARKLLRDNRFFAVLSQQVESIPQKIIEAHPTPIDSFRPSFPPVTSISAVLDFDAKDQNGDPITPEGKLKFHLLEETDDSSNILTIYGIGGVGKSTIVRALSVDDQIRRHFSDGVHLVKLGQDANPSTLLRRLCQVLKDAGAEKSCSSIIAQNDLGATLDFFEKWFDGKRCLFLIDDVWAHAIGLPSLSRLSNVGRELSGNTVLMTTREHEVASIAPSKKMIPLEPREPKGEVARQILFLHAEYQNTEKPSDSVQESINEILAICAGLPVSLAVSGKNVKKMSMRENKNTVWTRYLSQLMISREKLLRQNVGNYGNLFATIATSISFMDGKSQEETLGFESALTFADMYRRFCVLKKQLTVPLSMVRHLWQTESEVCADVIATAFEELGLVTRELVGEDLWYIGLHDSLHDYAVSEAKRNGDIRDTHEWLLNGYEAYLETSSEATGLHSWWSSKLEADGYIHSQLCRHLLGAGRGAELVKLLMTPQWAERQIKVTDVSFLETDLSFGIQAMKDGVVGTNHMETEKALLLISQAVTLSSGFTAHNAIEVYFQLHGRLKGFREISEAIERYVSWIETYAERPLMLSENNFLGEPGGVNTRVVSFGKPVRCMVMMQDSQRVACGCSDGRILIVNGKKGIVEQEWKAHDDWVSALAVTWDGRKLVSVSWDKSAKVWDIETGRCMKKKDHTESLEAVAVMRDGRRVITVTGTGAGTIWELETGQVLSKLFTGLDRIGCVTVTEDEEEVVVGGTESKLRIWNVSKDAQVGGSFDGHTEGVTCAVVTPGDKYIMSGSRDKSVRVWDARSHQQLGKALEGHTDLVICVTASDDGRRIISGSCDRTIRVWDRESGTQVCDPLEGHTRGITGVSILSGVDRIVSSSWDGTIRVWDVTQEKKKGSTNRHDDAVTGIAFTPNGELVVSASRDRTIRIWDSKSGEQIGDPLKGHTDGVNDVVVTPDERFIVSVSNDKTVRIWDLNSHELVRTFTGHVWGVECVALTGQGDRAVTGSRDKTVRVWDITSMGDNDFVLAGHEGFVSRVYVSDDGLRIISIALDKVYVWEMKTRKLVKKLRVAGVRNQPRREVLKLVGDEGVDNVKGDMDLLIPLHGLEIVYGEGEEKKVVATMETSIRSWAQSSIDKKVCMGLSDGQVAIVKLVV